MVFDITDPFCTPILRGLVNALYQASYLSLLADAHNEPHRFERYLEMLLDRRVEGLIIIANWLVTDIKLLADLTELQVPTVVTGREFELEKVSTVSVDNEGGASLALEHLYLSRPPRNRFSARAKSAYQQRPTLEGNSQFCTICWAHPRSEAHEELPESLDANSSFEAGAHLTGELLRRGKPFTALMAYDVCHSLGRIARIKEKGPSRSG